MSIKRSRIKFVFELNRPMVWMIFKIIPSRLGAFLIILYLTQSSAAIMKGLAIAIVLTPYGMIIYFYIKLRY